MRESIIAKKAQITTAMLDLRFAYPASKLPDEHWDAVTQTWETKLVDYPSEVLLQAFDRVQDRHRQWFPTLPQMLEVCDEELHRFAARQADARRMLPPPASRTRAEALREFFEVIDAATREPMGDWSPDNQAIIERLLVLMHPLFGFPASEARGDPTSDDPEKRFDIVRVLIHNWQRAKFKPHAIVHALKRVPSTFAKWPTAGMLDELIRGSFNPRGWPKQFLKEPPEGGTETP